MPLVPRHERFRMIWMPQFLIHFWDQSVSRLFPRLMRRSLFTLAYSRIVLPTRVAAILAVVFLLPGCASFPSLQTALPYEKVRSVVYDNDEVVDMYTDEYIMALADAMDISLVGVITSTSTAPYNRWVTSEDYERMVRDRVKSVSLARGMGWEQHP